MSRQGRGRHGSHIPVHAVLVHREAGNDTDRIAGLVALDTFTDDLDGSRCLVAEARWELRLVQVCAAAEHGLGAIEAQGMDADLHFARAGQREVYLFESQNLGPSGLVETHYACHEIPPCSEKLIKMSLSIFGRAETLRPSTY